MKAIVLTCDRYLPFAEHMIRSYDRLWPDHPFSFRIACQGLAAKNRLRVDSRVEFVKTPEDIKNTVLQLLEHMPDNEWIYWSIDDKYLIDIDIDCAKAIAGWIPTIEDASVSGVSFARARRLYSLKHVDYADALVRREGDLLLRRRDYSQIWLHQFLRAKVLKHLFRGFPDRPFRAKEMDEFLNAAQLPSDHRLYVTIDNHVVFGESTTRGGITRNCVESFVHQDLPIPEGFPISDNSLVIGKLPTPNRYKLKRIFFERPAIALDRLRMLMKAGRP